MPKDQEWFEMPLIRKRRFATSVWIPLRISEWTEKTGQYGHIGYLEEFFGAASLAVAPINRPSAEKLDWHYLGIARDQGSYASRDKKTYKPADVYQYDEGKDLGIELVLVQHFNRENPSEWHLNQDLVFALRLMREGDSWVRPDEDYCEVVRLRRDSNHHPIAIEIRTEFLRDYLAARQMVLCISSYRQRTEICENSSHIRWPKEGIEESLKTDGLSDRFKCHAYQIMEGGHFAEGTYAVFQISRTDVDPGEDVPVFGKESDENTEGKSWTGKREGRLLTRIEGELWRQEWIEPTPTSTRVRGDPVPTGLNYIVDASGERLSSEALDDQDIGRWLWFKPEVVSVLTGRRGGHLSWYTQDTGNLRASPDYDVHFGVNSIGLINIYAYDIAKLPEWQQKIWSAYNVSPDGGVSEELLASQMRAQPAHTSSPEDILPKVLHNIGVRFEERTGLKLFHGEEPSLDRVYLSIHRFRAVPANGVYALAKDIIRLVADRIDASQLQKIAAPPKGERWGSLKSLEKFLSILVSPMDARDIMAPLFGAYELRLRDAHVASSEVNEVFHLARVDQNASPVTQGFQLIGSVTSVLLNIEEILQQA